jgi:glycine/D-amino acid oxidase-like deaminating enzyme
LGYDLSSWYPWSTASLPAVALLTSGEAMGIVICGGGVIDACTVYYLSLRGIDVIVVERTEVAVAASGEAGGFLALDRCHGSPLEAPARQSFGLHAAPPCPTRLLAIGLPAHDRL